MSGSNSPKSPSPPCKGRCERADHGGTGAKKIETNETTKTGRGGVGQGARTWSRVFFLMLISFFGGWKVGGLGGVDHLPKKNICILY